MLSPVGSLLLPLKVLPSYSLRGCRGLQWGGEREYSAGTARMAFVKGGRGELGGTSPTCLPPDFQQHLCLFVSDPKVVAEDIQTVLPLKTMRACSLRQVPCPAVQSCL